jgi:hypothetical protein
MPNVSPGRGLRLRFVSDGFRHGLVAVIPSRRVLSFAPRPVLLPFQAEIPFLNTMP